ncbi:MAG: biosynthetic-type acetolactate synthase large subunit [Clostridia bacterium]|jgi:acetolactate synthase-1/2/3 large subunit|nr:biosynthetic-type acetolactate synthase large subunit [Clostridia bacterium]MDD4145504.1 biosynthetic-type acetolactate synthase large subunit [Clostridia bacterium]MDD4665001.1 biosynthetic-type acetolactate synthase large subunit [Clostridia bacterium]
MEPGAEILVKCLEKEGVEVIFGYPGGAALEIFDALHQSPQIKTVLVRQEQGAAHAASGYARASGKTGVCLATSGPGATNLITGVATAYMDSIPMVVITGQVSSGMVGTDAFQEVDITGISDPITKHNYLVKEVSQLPRIVKEAFYIAGSGRPGPVLLDIPKDVSASLAEFKECKSLDLRGYKPNLVGHKGQIKQVIQLIKEAQRPLVCAGGGVISAQAEEELLYLAEKLHIPVVNTLMGLGSIPREHPLSLGMLGAYGLAKANLAVQSCDLFIALGMRFDDRVTGNVQKFAPQAKIMHIDIDSAEIGKNVWADLPLVGDLKIVLNQILECLPKEKKESWWLALENVEKVEIKSVEKEEGIIPSQIIAALNDVLPAEAIITTDVGQHQMWAAQGLNLQKPRTFISSGGLGTMGYGIPAGIGAQEAFPKRPVVVITGDGSFQMGIPELGTCLEEELPLKIIIFNNQALGMVKQLQDHYCEGRHVSVHFKKLPKFQDLARAYGALSLRVEKQEELSEKLEKFIQHPGLVILEVLFSSHHNVYPMVLNAQGLDEMIYGRNLTR